MTTQQPARSGWRDRLIDRYEDRVENPRRGPLTPGQHVLHLLLTVLTGGLWAPVWFIRAWRGNPIPPPVTGS